MRGITHKILILFLDIAVFFAWNYAHVLTKVLEKIAPVCMVKEATTLYCPTCGATRALNRLAIGDIQGAMYYNVFVFVLVIYILFVLLLANIWCFSGNKRVQKLLRLFTGYKAVVAVGIFAGIFSVVRNFLLR